MELISFCLCGSVTNVHARRHTHSQLSVNWHQRGKDLTFLPEAGAAEGLAGRRANRLPSRLQHTIAKLTQERYWGICLLSHPAKPRGMGGKETLCCPISHALSSHRWLRGGLRSAHLTRWMSASHHPVSFCLIISWLQRDSFQNFWFMIAYLKKANLFLLKQVFLIYSPLPTWPIRNL